MEPSTDGDGTINIAEKAAGFPISGNTGTEGGVTVAVTIGTAVTERHLGRRAIGRWPYREDASYITGTSVSLGVTAIKTGETDA